MKKMNTQTKMTQWLFAAFILFFGSFAFAQSDTLTKVEKACAVFPSYKAGENGGVLSSMEYAVFGLPADSPELALVETKLLDTFAKATFDGQRTIARVLFFIGSKKSVDAMIPFLDSKANDGETAKLARMVIDAVKKNRPVSYPKNDLFVAPYKQIQIHPNDFHVESEQALLARLNREIALFANQADLAKRQALLESLSRGAELTPKPSIIYEKLMNATPDERGKKAIFDIMGKTSISTDVLEYALTCMSRNDALRTNAGLAVVRLANRLRYKEVDLCVKALWSVYKNIDNTDVRGRAKAVLRQTQIRQGSIKSWSFSECYTVAKDATVPIIDRQFAPEKTTTSWKQADNGWLREAWDLDVAVSTQTGSCVYLRTVYRSPQEKIVLAEMKKSGPIRIWLNGKKVFSDTSDKTCDNWDLSFPMTLKKGDNEIMVKTVHGPQPWIFALRFSGPDGLIPAGK